MRSVALNPCKEWSPNPSPLLLVLLGLGIDAFGSGRSHVNAITHHGKSAFTAAQEYELHQQALIFKYMVSGLPIPFHLVLPIWKSSGSSIGAASGGIHNQFPRFFGFSPPVFDYGSMMDPEPGRCRRTDGKKWRCSRDVVPGQKYCERHMHRGRQRSRKHVESSKHISESDTTITITSSDTTTAINSYNTTNTIANLSVSAPPNLQLMIPSSDYSNNVPATAEITTTSSSSGNSRVNKINVISDSSATPITINFCNSNNRSKNNVGVNRDASISTTTFISAVADKSNSKDNSYCIGDKDTGFGHSNYRLVREAAAM
ncbi:unnamed protein product [Ilex paraguariensis]|uniref:Growth-regulating factor n=1 Tax=Ilex paraguariensis TaxID=185542 RepID=A0ABC8SHA6_9AQUA